MRQFTIKTSRSPNRVSLARALSKLGFCSRSQAANFIQLGVVYVNRVRQSNPHRWVDLSEDKISVEDRKVEKVEFRYVLFNKPVGVVTSRSHEHGHQTIYDLLEESISSLNPVGRLDKDTSGLLLLTNNNSLADYLTNPQSEVTKTYRTVLNRPITPQDIGMLSQGVEIIADGRVHRAKPDRLKRIEDCVIELSIHEGKNRQVRKMFAALGYIVTALKRVCVGSLYLGDLKEGEWRKLTREEIVDLAGRSRIGI